MKSHESRFENAEVGNRCQIDDNVILGYRFHVDCGPTRLGRECSLRAGTVIYGDVIIGNYFLGGHNIVIRAQVRTGDHCAMGNHLAIEGIVRLELGFASCPTPTYRRAPGSVTTFSSDQASLF